MSQLPIRHAESRENGIAGRKVRNLVASFVVALFAGLAATPAMAQPGDAGIESVAIGFDGQIVLGRWVPVSVSLTDSLKAPGNRIQIETLDGDAVPIRYSHDGPLEDHEGLIRIGRAAGVTVRVLNEQDEILASRRFGLDELRESHAFLPGTTKLTLYIGLASKDQQESLQLERPLSDQSVIISSYRQLPANWVGYESVNTVVIAPLQVPKGDFDQTRVDALDQWVRSGGRSLITGGAAFATFFDSGFSSLSPGNLLENTSIDDTGAIELFASATDQLVKDGGPVLPLTAIEFAADRKTFGSAGGYPLIAHWIHGFGRVSFVALDFTSEPVSSWDGRRRLLALAVDDSGGGDGDATQHNQSGRVSHIGYTDMVGQLRAAMDQFKRVPFITFTLVALLVGLFILAIGPGDFFFLRKVTGRMEMTWLTFTLICVAFCGLAWFLATKMKSSETELNQVEIVDIDSITGQSRGTVWTHVYSPGTENYDISMPAENRLTGPIEDRWIAWQGLPGSGLGSMQSRTDLGLYRRQYDCNLSPEGSNLDAIPMQNASTKTFSGFWRGRFDREIRSNLRQSPNSDALLGNFSNPLDRQLYDAVILYGDWVYILENRPLEPDETIVVEDDLREKTIAGYFTRLGGRGSDEVSAAWDPSGTRLPRILQMMSFFDVIGGESYTRLTNDFHTRVDLSYQLGMGRAVLIGQVPRVTTPLTVNGQPFANYDKRMSLVRIVLPVKPRQ